MIVPRSGSAADTMFSRARTCTSSNRSAVVPRLTVTPGRIERPGPSRPGEHNEEIYCGRLGLSKDELTRLAERGVI